MEREVGFQCLSVCACVHEHKYTCSHRDQEAAHHNMYLSKDWKKRQQAVGHSQEELSRQREPQCKGPEAEGYLACSRDIEEPKDQEQNQGRGIRVRPRQGLWLHTNFTRLQRKVSNIQNETLGNKEIRNTMKYEFK